MQSLYEKFKTIIYRFRVTADMIWHPRTNIEFLKILNVYEKGELQFFFDKLVSEGLFVVDEDNNYVLTQHGEDILYCDMDHCRDHILKKMYDMEMKEGHHWPFSNYISFKGSLNPIEEKHFCDVINSMIDEGIFVKDNEFNNLVLTKKGEEEIRRLFYK